MSPAFYTSMDINFGYCCVSTLHSKLKCSRQSTKTYLENHGPDMCHDYLLEKARNNLADLEVLLKENKKNNINAFRVPEQILPQVDLHYYKISELKEELEKAGKVANELDIQLSTHPSQYYVLNSFRQDVVEKSIGTLDLFAEVFAWMKLDKTPNMTLHVGVKNGYQSPEEAGRAFAKNFRRMSENARNILVVENDHVSFTVDNCLKIQEEIGVPIVFDNKHFEWNTGDLSYEEAVEAVSKTWGNRVPKFHLSSDKPGKKHAHSEYVEYEDYRRMEQAIEKAKIPKCYVMLECKEKDRAVVKLQKEIEEKEKSHG